MVSRGLCTGLLEADVTFGAIQQMFTWSLQGLVPRRAQGGFIHSKVEGEGQWQR